MKKHSMSNRAGCGLLLLSTLVLGPAWAAEEQAPSVAACMRPSCERTPVIMLRRTSVSPAQVSPAQVSPAQVSPAQVSPAQAAFNRADSDHDGRLTRQESEHFPAMAPHFMLIDTNRDNFLSFDELMRAASEPA